MAEREPVQRHPWLTQLIEQPEIECARLFAGTADLGSYARADPADVVVMLAGDLPADDPIIKAFDRGFLAWLEEAIAARPMADARRRRMLTLDAIQVFRAISLVSGPKLLGKFWHEYIRWYRWVDSNALTERIDLRAEFLKMLAQSQARLPPAEEVDRTSHWLNLCTNVGRSLPDSYLDIGLLGLRRAAQAHVGPGNIADRMSGEEYCIVGLTNWAAGRRREEVEAELARQWSTLKLSFPHLLSYWRECFERLVLPRKAELDQQLVLDWAVTVGAELRVRTGVGTSRRSYGSVRVDTDLSSLDWQGAKAKTYKQMRVRLAAVRKGGPTIDLAYAVSQLGTAVLHHSKADPGERGKVALELAMLGLTWEPQNPFCWSLWRDALFELGKGEGAETVAWEGMRRFPHEAAMSTGLAKHWFAQALDMSDPRARKRKTQKALYLLKRTWERTGNAFAFTMTAQGLMLLKRRDEAQNMLREALTMDKPNNWKSTDVIVARNLLGNLLTQNNAPPSNYREVAEIMRRILDKEYNQFSENLLIRSLIAINEPDGIVEAIQRLRTRKDFRSRNLLETLLASQARSDGREYVEPDPDAGDIVSISRSEKLEQPEEAEKIFDKADAPNTAVTATNDNIDLPTRMAANAMRTARVASLEATIIADRMVEASASRLLKNQVSNPVALKRSSGLKSTVKAALAPAKPEYIGSLSPHFIQNSDANVEALSKYADMYAAADSGSGAVLATADYDPFARFMITAFQPWSDRAEGLDNGEHAYDTNFAIAFMDALRRKDMEFITDLERRYPQEEIICKLAIEKIIGTESSVRALVNELKTRPSKIGTTIGSASRVIIGIVNDNTARELISDDDRLIPTALASTFELPLAFAA